MSTVGLAPRRRDVLAIMVTGLLLLLLLLDGVSTGEPQVAGPTDVASAATPLVERCDLAIPCAPDIATEAPARCDPGTPCVTTTVTTPSTTVESPGVDALIANVLCDLNSPCAPDLVAAWNRLCDLNTPCLPGAAAPGGRR